MHTDPVTGREGRSKVLASLWSRQNLVMLGAFVGVLLVGLAMPMLEALRYAPAEADYSALLLGSGCQNICRSSDAEHTIRVEGAPAINVRVPLNYQPERAHPLLVVFPPAGYDRRASESYYALTTFATAHGYVVAYSDALPLAKTGFGMQAKVAEAVAARWCIDKDRITFVGHSDGASTAYGIALLERQALQPHAMILSGAGLSGADLAREACPVTQSVMVIHGERDELFPDFGRQAAHWWANCLRCNGAQFQKLADGCVEAVGCQHGARLVYCTPDTDHRTAPTFTSFTFDFLSQSNASQREE